MAVKNVYVNEGDLIRIHVMNKDFAPTKAGYIEASEYYAAINGMKSILVTATDNTTLSFNSIIRPTIMLGEKKLCDECV